MTRPIVGKPKSDVLCSSTDLTGHTVVIVEANPTPFTARLQSAVEQTGAQAVLALSTEAASQRVKRSRVSAAVVNVTHRTTAEQLGVLYVLFTPQSPPSFIVAALRRLLRGPC